MTPHAKLLDHFANPRNAGTLAGLSVQTENPACGDILRLYVDVQAGVVADVRYQVRGCTAAIAAGSALTTLMLGRTVADVARITAADIETELGELQPASKHAAVLCVDTVKRLVQTLG